MSSLVLHTLLGNEWYSVRSRSQAHTWDHGLRRTSRRSLQVSWCRPGVDSGSCRADTAPLFSATPIHLTSRLPAPRRQCSTSISPAHGQSVLRCVRADDREGAVPNRRPVVMLTFDDGYTTTTLRVWRSSSGERRHLLRHDGASGTRWLTVARFRGSAHALRRITPMSWPQMREMRDAGMLFVLHPHAPQPGLA